MEDQSARALVVLRNGSPSEKGVRFMDQVIAKQAIWNTLHVMATTFALGGKLFVGALRKGALYLGVNFFGVLLCLCFSASALQMRLREQREFYDAGDSIAFITFCGPILLICALFNLVLFLKASWSIYRYMDFRQFVALGLIILLWAAARECTRLSG